MFVCARALRCASQPEAVRDNPPPGVGWRSFCGGSVVFCRGRLVVQVDPPVQKVHVSRMMTRALPLPLLLLQLLPLWCFLIRCLKFLFFDSDTTLLGNGWLTPGVSRVSSPASWAFREVRHTLVSSEWNGAV